MPKYLGGGKLKIQLGNKLNEIKDKEGNITYSKGDKLDFICKIKGYIPNENVKTTRIIKKSNGKFYLLCCIELESELNYVEHNNSKDWISLDPNHLNLFTGIDNDGETYEMEKIKIVNELDEEIDIIKSKRDKRVRGSKRWLYYDKRLKKLYNKREEQLKQAFYTISHFLVQRFNCVIIGDYTPSNNTAKHKNMKRSMLNQTNIGLFRRILGHVASKYRKMFIIADEKFTTQACCITAELTKRSPKERSWFIEDRLVLRDVNSAVNIAKVAGYELDINKANLSTIDNKLSYSFRNGLDLRSTRHQTGSLDDTTKNGKYLNCRKLS